MGKTAPTVNGEITPRAAARIFERRLVTKARVTRNQRDKRADLLLGSRSELYSLSGFDAKLWRNKHS